MSLPLAASLPAVRVGRPGGGAANSRPIRPGASADDLRRWAEIVAVMSEQLITEAQLRAASMDFYEALADVLAGDPEPMFGLWSRANDVSYMGPMGDLLLGWEQIRESWQDQAEAGLGGSVSSEQTHFICSGSLGIVVGYERGTVLADGKPVPVNIRATSTYRLEDGQVKMIGHHTDRF